MEFCYNHVNTRKRNINLDAIKGIAIFLVVLGHCIQYIYAPNNYDDILLYRFIYSFHMPLFFLISGFLVYKPDRNLNFDWIKKRFYNLVIPFGIWIFLGYFIEGEYRRISIIQKLANIILDPSNGGLWFLWVLFLCCFIFFLLKKIYLKNENIVLLVAVLLFALIKLIISGLKFDYFGIKLCSYYILFYITGYLLSKYKRKLIKYVNGIGVTCFILFIPFAICWRRIDPPLFSACLEQLFIGNRILTILTKIFIIFYRYYIVAFLGIGFTFFIVYKFKFNWIKNKIAFIGKYTLEIYVLQWYFFYSPTANNLFNTVVSIFLSLALPIGIAFFLEKNTILGFLFFGKVKSLNKSIQKSNL